MIRDVPACELVCDGCEKVFDSNDYQCIALSDKEARDNAKHYGWMTWKNEDFCPVCLNGGKELTGYGALREEFIALLTRDSETTDRRRKDYNQAVFMDNGESSWTSIDLDMVLEKFDKAVKNINRRKKA